MKKSRMKNIFVNIMLGFALTLSVVGGAFLMTESKREQIRRAYAAEIDPITAGVPFYSTLVDQTANGITNGQFLYEKSVINYINVENLIYYVSGTELKTAGDVTASDILQLTTTGTFDAIKKYYVVGSDSVVIGEPCVLTSESHGGENFYKFTTHNDTTYYMKEDGTQILNEDYVIVNTLEYSFIKDGGGTPACIVIGKKYIINNNIYLFNYNNTTYYCKDGRVYSDLQCSNPITYDYDIISDYTINVNTYSNSIKRYTFNETGYYALMNGTDIAKSADGKDLYVTIAPGTGETNSKKFVYEKIDAAGSITMRKLQDGTATDITATTTITNIFIHSRLASEGISQEYINVFGEKYYYYNGNLYTESVFKDLCVTIDEISGYSYSINLNEKKVTFTKTADNSETEITFSTDTPNFIIESVKYYALANALNGKTYYIRTDNAVNLYEIDSNTANIASNTGNTITYTIGLKNDDTYKVYLNSTDSRNFTKADINKANVKDNEYYVLNENIGDSSNYLYSKSANIAINIPNTGKTFAKDKMNSNFTINIYPIPAIQSGGDYYYRVNFPGLTTNEATKDYFVSAGTDTDREFKIQINGVDYYLYDGEVINNAGLTETTTAYINGNTLKLYKNTGRQNPVTNITLKGADGKEISTVSRLFNAITNNETITTTDDESVDYSSSGYGKLSINGSTIFRSNYQYYVDTTNPINNSYQFSDGHTTDNPNNIAKIKPNSSFVGNSSFSNHQYTISLNYGDGNEYVSDPSKYFKIVDDLQHKGTQSFYFAMNIDETDNSNYNNVYKFIEQIFYLKDGSNEKRYYVTTANGLEKGSIKLNEDFYIVKSGSEAYKLMKTESSLETTGFNYAIIRNNDNVDNVQFGFATTKGALDQYAWHEFVNLDGNPKKYYIVNSRVKTHNSSIRPIGSLGDELGYNEASGIYTFESSFTASKTESETILINTEIQANYKDDTDFKDNVKGKYFKVNINGQIFYVKYTLDTDTLVNNTLFRITGDGTQNNKYTVTAVTSAQFNTDTKYVKIECANFETDDIKVSVRFSYQLLSSGLLILNETTKPKNNFINFDTQYFYHDTGLYLDMAHTHKNKMQDFAYEPEINAIMIENNSYPVQSIDYYTVDLPEVGRFYVNDGALYSTLIFNYKENGGAVTYIAKYTNKVTNTVFEYKVDEHRQIVSIFTSQAKTAENLPPGVTFNDNKGKNHTALASFTATSQFDETTYYANDSNTYIVYNTSTSLTPSENKYYEKIAEPYANVDYYVQKNQTGSSAHADGLYVYANRATDIKIPGVNTFSIKKVGTTSFSYKLNNGPEQSAELNCRKGTTSPTLSYAYVGTIPTRLYSFTYNGTTYYISAKEFDEATDFNDVTLYSIANVVMINVLEGNSETGYYIANLFAPVTITGTKYYVNLYGGGFYNETFVRTSLTGYTIYRFNTTSNSWYVMKDGSSVPILIDITNAVKGVGETNKIKVEIKAEEVVFTDEGDVSPAKAIKHTTIRYVNSRILDIDVSFRYNDVTRNAFIANNGTFAAPDEMYVNGTKMTYTGSADFATISTTMLGTNLTYAIHKTAFEGVSTYYTIIFRYDLTNGSQDYYAVYIKDKEMPTNVYYLADNTKINDFVDGYAVNTSTTILTHSRQLSTPNNGKIEYTGYVDYYVTKLDTGYQVFTSSKYYNYNAAKLNIGGTDYNYIDYGKADNVYYVIKGGKLYYYYEYKADAINITDNAFIEAKRINFEYNFTGNNVVYKENTYATQTNLTHYIETSNNYYIVAEDNNVYNTYVYGNASATPQTRESVYATRISSSVRIVSNGTSFDVTTSNGRAYQDTAAIKDKPQFVSESQIMLDNFVSAQDLSLGTTTASIKNLYIQFGDKKAEEGAISGLATLEVQAFLRNEEVSKYSTLAESYFDSRYGIRIDINNVESQNVKYGNQDKENINMYWFQYFDLHGIKAIIGDNKAPVDVFDATGYYTIVFTYSTNKVVGSEIVASAKNTYTYSFYLSENSAYVEYPTFNTIKTVGTGVYETVVTRDETKGTNNYYYNNQSYDIPTYIFNATKFRVEYGFKFNQLKSNYATSFEIRNTSKFSSIVNSNNEYGVLQITKDGTLDQTIIMQINSALNAIDYYKDSISSANLIGSLYIEKSTGKFYLSLENYAHYNPKNKSEYTNTLDYYKAGRLIRNGAGNTIMDYYAIINLTELGDYEFKNIRLMSAGTDTSYTTTYVSYPADVENGAEDVLGSRYKDVVIDAVKGTTIKFRGVETMQYGAYDDNGLFVYKDTPMDHDKNNTILSNGSLKIYGITTSFKKNNNTIAFNKLDENIYSNLTNNTVIPSNDDKNSNTTDITKIFTGSNKLAQADKVSLYFNNENFKYNIPLTNLQPIYFNYFGNISYSQSKYMRYTGFSYECDKNGNMTTLTIDTTSGIMLDYTNKTTINKSGAYIMQIVYNNERGLDDDQKQYFMFVIDNTAPNMEIRTHAGAATEGVPFVSNTMSASASRYTNTRFVSVNYVEPNYFQGDVYVTYVATSYDQNTVLNSGNIVKNNIMPTSEGRYTFSIHYGVNSQSYSNTYIIVDQTTPNGTLYNVIGSAAQKYVGNKYDSNIFSEMKTFVSNKFKAYSGAPVYAKIKTISLDSYDRYAESLNKLSAITTDVVIKAANELFDNSDDLNNSPTYNFVSADVAAKGGAITSGQILGLTTQSAIYIIKLYDAAGNSEYYYYFYDTSTPYMLYTNLKEANAEPQKTIENGTVEGNTLVSWGNYKAIRINTDNKKDNLYAKFISSVNSNKQAYNGMFTQTVNNTDGKPELYLFIPISTALVSYEGNSKYAITPVPSAANVAGGATIYTAKHALKANFVNANTSTYWNSNINLNDMFVGDKQYTFVVTDAIGNSTTQLVTMNSSVAKETFYGKNTDAKLDSSQMISNNNVYNISELTYDYKTLSDKTFKAKITYSYYPFDMGKYLQNNEEIDTSYTPYDDYIYDTTYGKLYKFDIDKYYLCDVNRNIIESRTDTLTVNQVLTSANTFVKGYPFGTGTDNNSTVETESDGKYVSGTVNERSNQTALGLYIFKRVYITNDTGNIITNEDIDASDSIYEDLQDDLAIRYYVYVVDRNDIISLVYSGSNLDRINSIGDNLSIILGNADDPRITVELLKTYEKAAGDSGDEINTNKLRVKSDFPIDKYSTAEKLAGNANLKLFKRYNSDNKTNILNYVGDEFSKKWNANKFKYTVSLQDTSDGSDITETVINADGSKTTSIKAEYGDLINNNFSLVKKANYRLSISDNSSVTYSVKNGDIQEQNTSNPNTYYFIFGIKHDSPEGVFQTKADDVLKSIVDLEERDEYDNVVKSTGKNVVYKNINKEFLQFTFTQSASIYDAKIDPYDVVIKKDGSVILQTGKDANGNITATSITAGADVKNVIKFTDGDGTSTLPTYSFVIFNGNESGYLSKADDNARYTVEVHFAADNKNDYLVTEYDTNIIRNYYNTTFEIYVDNKAPSDNLDTVLAANDPNLDEYCKTKYNGRTYSQLLPIERDDLLKHYAFAVNINANNSTKFKYSQAEGVGMYLRKIGSDLTKYVFSYLPNESGDNKTEIFNRTNTTKYNPYTFNQDIDTEAGTTKGFDFNKLPADFKQGYYELIEEDEAENLTRYIVYIYDNEKVEYGVNYTNNSKTNNYLYYFAKVDNKYLIVTKENENWIIKDVYGTTYNGEVKPEGAEEPLAIHYNNVEYPLYGINNPDHYYANIDSTEYSFDYRESIEEKPDLYKFYNDILSANANISYSSTYQAWITNSGIDMLTPYQLLHSNNEVLQPTINYVGFYHTNKTDDKGTKVSSFDMFDISRIQPIIGISNEETGGYLFNDGKPYTNSDKSPLFDQFVTIRISSANKNGDVFTAGTLLSTLVSDPYTMSMDQFYNLVTVTIQDIINTNAITIFSYQIEITNRFGDNFVMFLNRPDAELDLKFTSANESLTVTVPKRTDHVFIDRFTIQTYSLNGWQYLTSDINSKTILSSYENIYSDTSYVLGKGIYKFTACDNFGRTCGTPIYKNVGGGDESYNFAFNSKYIQGNLSYITSRDFTFTINEHLYNINFGLRDCIKVSTGENEYYYDIKFEKSGDTYKKAIGKYSEDGKTFKENEEGLQFDSIIKDESGAYAIAFTNSIFTSQNSDPTNSNVKTTFGFSRLNNFNGDNGLCEYVIEFSWAGDPENPITYNVKIDSRKPVISFISDTPLTVVESGSYYKNFHITWSSNYLTTGQLVKTINSVTTTLNITAADQYEVGEIGGYTLIVTDEIGNETRVNFTLKNSGNRYYSVVVDTGTRTFEPYESDYISTDNNGYGYIIKYYYFLEESGKGNINDYNVIINTDQTKGIGYEKVESISEDYLEYNIIRNYGDNIDPLILNKIRVVKVKPIKGTTAYGEMINNLNIIYTDGTSLNPPMKGDEIAKELGTNNGLSYDQKVDKIELTIKSFYGSETDGIFNGNKVFTEHRYNGKFVKTYSSGSNNDPTYTITIASTGVHEFIVRDSVGNVLKTLRITLIKSVLFDTNGENPINNRFFNNEVTLNIPTLSDYYTRHEITVIHNGVEKKINDIAPPITTVSNTAYTFKESGNYKLIINAYKASNTTQDNADYSSVYEFTILNPNVMKMTFGFSSAYGFTIQKVVRNDLDITSLITQKSHDSLWITSGDTDTAGLYTITLLGYDEITNDYFPFTFSMRINNETPSITPINYTYGTSTTKAVTLQYNAALIYSQVGESYILVKVNGSEQERYEIYSESEDKLSNIVINSTGKWTIEIYNKDNNFIVSYTVNKATPLNSSAKLIIIIAVVVVVLLIVTFIILRKHTKFR